MKEYDYLIIGSGIFGAVFACLKKREGKKCLVIDKRPHLGGNLYCERTEGIDVHKYGPHIFHTSSKKVWDFVNSFVEFNRFTNSPLARYKGELYNLPFNMNTFRQMWGIRTPEEASAIIERQKEEAVSAMKEAGHSTPANLEEQAKILVGQDIFEKLIKGYTEKQWGRKCSQLPPFIIRRLPVRLTYDNNYFNDKYQGIPVGGYNRLIEGLLEGIETRTGADFFEDREYWSGLAETMVFTGQIDEFFDCRFGRLLYRSLVFEEEIWDCPNLQGNAVVNYTDIEIPYTRIIEHKHFGMTGQEVYNTPKTVISKEFPSEWTPGMEPYYPVNDEANDRLYSQYKVLADREKNVIFGGRLAEYRYYDMAPIVERLLDGKYDRNI